MLSRVAENIYWMARYVERAENVARIVDVNNHMMLDAAPGESTRQWAPLISIMADEEPFRERYPAGPTKENVLAFLVCDEKNPNSILSCLRGARENARSIREIIPSEMWLQVNTLYLSMRTAASIGHRCATADLFQRIKSGCHLFFGMMQDIMAHGEAYRFAQLGRFMERADKTSRVVDVKYFILLPKIADVGSPLDAVQWMALLRSVSAYEAFWKKMGRIEPAKVVQFLLLDIEFPRSVYYSLLHLRGSIREIARIVGTPDCRLLEDAAESLCMEMDRLSAEGILHRGLHEFVDHLQTRLNELHGQIYGLFFAMKPLEVEAVFSQHQSQGGQGQAQFMSGTHFLPRL